MRQQEKFKHKMYIWPYEGISTNSVGVRIALQSRRQN